MLNRLLVPRIRILGKLGGPISLTRLLSPSPSRVRPPRPHEVHISPLASLQFARYSTEPQTSGNTISKSSISISPLSRRELFQFLNLESFTESEIKDRFKLLSHSPSTSSTITLDSISKYTNQYEFENSDSPQMAASRFLKTFQYNNETTKSKSSISLEEFNSTVTTLASKVDVKHIAPITLSMLLVGSSVGIVTPIMPYVVESLSLSTHDFGYVIAAFGAAKLLGNIPSAILVEKHGRKPYLVFSLALVAIGNGGIGIAMGLDHLIVLRLFTGFGVAALSTAATLAITDISTPLNRASTMAPVMAAFSAGTALGPAIGGLAADSFGVTTTFYMVRGELEQNLNGMVCLLFPFD